MESTMYYVIPVGKNDLSAAVEKSENYGIAKDICEGLKQETGKHHFVVKFEIVWTSETLEEALASEA
jgi:hypothetical protein